MSLPVLYGQEDEDRPLRASLSLSLTERLRDNIRRLRLSNFYVAVCAFFSFICTGLLLHSIFSRQGFGQPRPMLMFVSEALITVLIVAETFADMVLYGCREYWRNGWHVFDFVVCFICVASLAADVIPWIPVIKVSAMVGFPLLIIRYMAQTVRILRLLKNAGKAKAEMDVVDETSIILPSSRINHL